MILQLQQAANNRRLRQNTCIRSQVHEIETH